MKEKYIDTKKISRLVLVICLFFFISLVQLIPILIFNIDTTNITTKTELALTTFSDIVLLIILIYFYHDTLINDFKKLKSNFYEIIDNGIKYWFIGLSIMVVSNLIINLFIPMAKATNEAGVQEYIHSSFFLAIISVGILAPIIEELTFRKSFKDVFKNKTLFVLVSGIFFGSLHVILSLNSMWDLFYIIPYSALGISLSYMYQKTDNIYTSIIMHIFHNTVLTMLSIISGAMIIL